MTQSLTNDKVGVLAYKLTVDGEVVESVDRDTPIEYLHGAQNIVAGLENALVGKVTGDKFSVVVPAADAYGDYDEEDVEDVPAEEFDDLEELTIGMEIEVMDEEGEFIEAVIVNITDEFVRLDYNAPLAGKVLHYEVEVLEVRDATEEELEMGFPESLIDEMYEDFDEEDDDHDRDD